MPELDPSFLENLVGGIYAVFLSQSQDSTTKLYILTRQFARAFGDEEQQKEYDKALTKIWRGDFLPTPTIEIILMRDLSDTLFRVSKIYRAEGKRPPLGDLNIILQMRKRQIMDIFFEIYAENSQQIKAVLPIQQLIESQKAAAK